MPASTTQPRWYVVQCKAREDRRALEHLERQGFECYRPTLAVEKRRLERKVERQEPLFPRYLFIRLSEIDSNWCPIRSTRGVSQLVRCNEKPVAVADAIIDGIRTRLPRIWSWKKDLKLDDLSCPWRVAILPQSAAES